MTSNGAAGQDREDGQKAAKRKPAVAAVGDGAISAKTPRVLTTIPPNQRASDSHDYTRLATLKVLNASFKKTHRAFKKTGRWFVILYAFDSDCGGRKSLVAFVHRQAERQPVVQDIRAKKGVKLFLENFGEGLP